MVGYATPRLPGDVRLTGYCNRCGACCTLDRDGETYFCEHLIRLKPLGEENATLCAVHDARTSLMPIRLVSGSGKIRVSMCVPDYPTDAEKKLPVSCTYKL